MGLSGLFAVFWLYYIYIVHGFRLSINCIDPATKPLAVAVLAGFISPAITSMTQPEWLTPTGVAFFAFVLGISISIDHVNRTFFR